MFPKPKHFVMHSVANSNSKLIREIKQLIHCQIKIFHRILKGEAVHFMHFLSFSPSFHQFSSYFIHFSLRSLVQNTISFIRLQRFFSLTLSMSLIHLLFSLFLFLHIELRRKTKNRRQKWPCIFLIHSDCNKKNKFVCMYDVYVLDYIACFTRMAAMQRKNEWVVVGKLTQNQIQKSDFLYAAGIYVCMCVFVFVYTHTYIYIV